MMKLSLDAGIMHPTAREGVLNLIPKPGKDTRIPKNLRPITLLNCDYKIIEKCVAVRLAEVTEQVINMDQKGFMPNRRISANIRKLLDLQKYCENKDKTAVILDLDIEKAFDKLSFSAIFGAMSYFGVSDYITKWIKTLYNSFGLFVQNNGHISERIEVNRGTHQGGVCSTGIFILAMELIAIDVRADNDIMGIEVGDIISLLNQFADDTDLTLEDSQEMVQAALKKFQQFEKQTGLKVNYDKTSLYRIGSLRHSKAEYYTQPDIKWCNQIKVLGIQITPDETEATLLNYIPLIEVMKQKLGTWYNRSLTLMGRVMVVNTLATSLFVYKMTTLPDIPPSLLKKIEGEIRRFIWKGRKAKIALTTLQEERKNGGLQLVNFKLKEQSLKISWIQILHNDTHTATVVYNAMGEVASVLREYIWKCNVHWKDIKHMKIQGLFWNQCMTHWAKINYDYSQDAATQPLWFNSFIRIQNSPIYWQKCFDKGLKWLGQLYVDGLQLTEKEAQELYGINSIQYVSLMRAIPEVWKEELKSDGSSTREKNLYVELLPKKHIVKTVYKKLQQAKGPSNRFRKEKWEEKLNANLTSFGNASRSVYSTTNVTKYRDFQYRLLHNIVTTKVDLARWNLSDNNLCVFVKGILKP